MSKEPIRGKEEGKRISAPFSQWYVWNLCNFQENDNFKEIAETGKERVVCRICEEQKVLFWSWSKGPELTLFLPIIRRIYFCACNSSRFGEISIYDPWRRKRAKDHFVFESHPTPYAIEARSFFQRTNEFLISLPCSRISLLSQDSTIHMNYSTSLSIVMELQGSKKTRPGVSLITFSTSAFQSGLLSYLFFLFLRRLRGQTETFLPIPFCLLQLFNRKWASAMNCYHIPIQRSHQLQVADSPGMMNVNLLDSLLSFVGRLRWGSLPEKET